MASLVLTLFSIQQLQARTGFCSNQTRTLLLWIHLRNFKFPPHEAHDLSCSLLIWSINTDIFKKAQASKKKAFQFTFFSKQNSFKNTSHNIFFQNDFSIFVTKVQAKRNCLAVILKFKVWINNIIQSSSRNEHGSYKVRVKKVYLLNTWLQNFICYSWNLYKCHSALSGVIWQKKLALRTHHVLSLFTSITWL